MKLHPDAVPRKDSDPQNSYDSLFDMCETVIKSESWDRVLRVERVSGTGLVRIIAVDDRPEVRDASIVFLESEVRFQEGLVPRQTIRNTCQKFLIACGKG